jgi:hypothetical protein
MFFLIKYSDVKAENVAKTTALVLLAELSKNYYLEGPLVQTQMLSNDFGRLALQSQLFGNHLKSRCGRF